MKSSASKQESAVRGRAKPSGGPGAGGSPDDILFEQPVQAAPTLGTTDDGWGALEGASVPGHADLLGGPEIMDLLSGSQNGGAPARPASNRPSAGRPEAGRQEAGRTGAAANAGADAGKSQVQPQRAQQTPRPPRSRPGGPVATAPGEAAEQAAAVSRPSSGVRSATVVDQGSGIRREGNLTVAKPVSPQFGAPQFARRKRNPVRVLLALGCLAAAAGASLWLHNVRHNPVLAAITGAIGAVLALMSWLSSR
jgi:hypothetical protein